MSSSEYETADEGESGEEEDSEQSEYAADEEKVLHEYGFFIHVSPDGTRWYLPRYYRADLDLPHSRSGSVELHSKVS